MRDVTSVLRSEEAVIGRWFSDSPYGLLFHGPDGRAWRISGLDAAMWRARAMADLHGFIAGTGGFDLLVLLMAGALAAIAGLLASALGLHGGVVAGAAMAGFVSVHPLLPFVRLQLFRKRQRRMKSDIVAALGLVSPLPADVAKPFRRRNIWYPLLYLTVFLMVASVVGIELVAHIAVGMAADPTHTVVTGVDMRLVMAPLLTGLGLSWGFYYLAKSTDRKQRHETRWGGAGTDGRYDLS
jgi:hypothetical protein